VNIDWLGVAAVYKLKNVYSKRTFDEFERWRKTGTDKSADDQQRDYEDTQVSSSRIAAKVFAKSRDLDPDGIWSVRSYGDLVHRVSFLTVMNKRLTLFYRGQTKLLPPLPALFRESWEAPVPQRQWRRGEHGERFEIGSEDTRRKYWEHLLHFGPRVARVCMGLGVPRWRGLRDIREAQWAVIQHYGLWPTPLVDVTQSLRHAASFALSAEIGYVFVVGMPNSTGSITFDIDQHVTLARLQAACPPVAKRPHFQEGFLIGHFPFYELDDQTRRKSNLLRRLVAVFELDNRGGNFWSEHFPRIPEEAVYPKKDDLEQALMSKFGPGGIEDVAAKAASL
jgi:hypothetical protein